MKNESDSSLNNGSHDNPLFFATKTTRSCTAHELLDFSTIVPTFCGATTLDRQQYCQICDSEDTALPCTRCEVVYYCSKMHRDEGRMLHKRQCMDLSHAKDDLDLVKTLKIAKDADLLNLRSPITSLTLITNWFIVWKHLECVDQQSDVFQRLMSELLSWPLILIRAITMFGLEGKRNLQVHILGANATYIERGLFSYFLKFFPLPDIEIFLIGQSLCGDMIPWHGKNCVGRWITLSCISDVFCQTHNNFALPDLIVAYHPDLKDEKYDWKPTLMYLVTKQIPSVFTMQSEERYREMFSLLNDKPLVSNIHFHRASPYPSMLKRFVRKTGKIFDVEVSNSYWIGFSGDAANAANISAGIFDSISQLIDMPSYELDNVLSSVVSKDDSMLKLGEGFIPACFELLFEDALRSFNAGVQKYVKKKSYTSATSFQAAIMKAQLPELKLLTKELQKRRDICEEKMRSVLASSYLYLGLLAKRDGDSAKAIEHTRVSLSVDPDFHLAYYNLGVIYQDIGDVNGMMESFRNATRLSPNDQKSWNGLGDAFHKMGMVREAENAYDIAKSLTE